MIGLEAANRLGGFLGRNVFSLLPPDRTARKNLLAAFPEKTNEERDAIRIAMWDNLGRVVAEYPHLEKFSPLGADPRITFTTPEHPENYKGQPILFLSGHFANWEMMPILGEQHGLKGATIVRPPNNPYIANWIARQRAINGPDSLVAKHNAARRMMGQLRGGGVIYMLIDQKLARRYRRALLWPRRHDHARACRAGAEAGRAHPDGVQPAHRRRALPRHRHTGTGFHAQRRRDPRHSGSDRATDRAYQKECAGAPIPANGCEFAESLADGA